MPWFAPTYNAAPQSTQPVVRLNNETGKREFALMRWGLVPYWAKDAKVGYSTINARAEEVADKPLYRDALKRRRCLIPADAFYEWQRINEKTKRPFAFGMQSGEPYAFAGLWERWKPKEGDPLETFTILTTDPNELAEPVHNRMPVILEPGTTRVGWRLVIRRVRRSICFGPIPRKRCGRGRWMSGWAMCAMTIAELLTERPTQPVQRELF